MGAGLDRALVERMLVTARGIRWGIGVGRFATVLESSVAHAFPDGPPSGDEVERYLLSLRLEDLALATACADGHEAAWDAFVRDVRPILYRSADALDPTGGARELADALFGELFGVRDTPGDRRSLFRYFHGRSSLSTWVRAVLSQRFIDRHRARRRVEDLPDEDSPGALVARPEAIDPERQRRVTAVHHALEAAIAGLPARDRLMLGCYYAENLKMAAIGKLLGESEATVSRRLARVRRDIADAVERTLMTRDGWSAAEVAEYVPLAVSDQGAFDVGRVFAETASRKADGSVRSMDRGGGRVERA